LYEVSGIAVAVRYVVSGIEGFSTAREGNREKERELEREREGRARESTFMDQ
jgi:hypothetical protein